MAFSRKERQAAAHLYRDGVAQAAIAIEVGCNPATVKVWVERYGWTRGEHVMFVCEYADRHGVTPATVSGWKKWGHITTAPGHGGMVYVDESDATLRERGLGRWSPPIRRKCRRCGGAFSRAANQPRQIYCSNRCEWRASRSARRAREREAGDLRVDIGYLYERDGGKCGICGEKVDRRCTYPHPRSPSPDHIVPLSKGGEHSYRNLQLAHWGCNDEKNTRAAGSQLRCFG